ncbi:MAG TPA: hypothetical protein VFP72_13935 [Kineosporiaceae bacterium]|nr:hypothetical protein [Kineosporiaceae bacterium]
MNEYGGQRPHDESPADGTEPSERTVQSGGQSGGQSGDPFLVTARLPYPGTAAAPVSAMGAAPAPATGSVPAPATAPATGTASVTGPATAPATAAVTGSAPTGKVRRGIRVRTVVFGLILLAISTSTLITLLSSIRVDGTAVTVAVLIGAGALLVAGGLAAAVREARGGPGA